jgi:hypothetical protein
MTTKLFEAALVVPIFATVAIKSEKRRVKTKNLRWIIANSPFGGYSPDS